MQIRFDLCVTRCGYLAPTANNNTVSPARLEFTCISLLFYYYVSRLIRATPLNTLIIRFEIISAPRHKCSPARSPTKSANRAYTRPIPAAVNTLHCKSFHSVLTSVGLLDRGISVLAVAQLMYGGSLAPNHCCDFSHNPVFRSNWKKIVQAKYNNILSNWNVIDIYFVHCTT